MEFLLVALAVGFFFLNEFNGGMLGFKPDIASSSLAFGWLAAYIVGKLAVSDRDTLAAFMRGFLLPVFPAVLIGLGQFLGVPFVLEFTRSYVSASNFEAVLDQGGTLRAPGLVGHWWSFGGYLVGATAVAVMSLSAVRNGGPGGRALPGAALFAALLGLVLTLTFAQIIAGAVVLILSLGPRLRRAQAIVALGVIAAIAYAMFGARFEDRLMEQSVASTRIGGIPSWVPSTIAYRLYVWTSQTIPMILERPLTGWGSNVYSGSSVATAEAGRSYPQYLIWQSPESQWFGTAMSHGLVGLVSLTCLLVAVFAILLCARRTPVALPYVAPLLWAFSSQVVAGFINPTITNHGFSLVLWPILGLLVSILDSAPEMEHRGHSRLVRRD
ncbi:O-antigen ligase family protein [Microbacterium jiangjiandongii]|uniref:O-antigen ligase family protein n=1 Tax=Microbacterium jiangjiandongii TaxID=3049071 RepID=UPI00214BAC7C|nr:O-antigen ligase family protein [Microbacterium sp. zg.Y843]MCR2815872.1 O-antigen ligase family protein [Microbacterium sp. zg.Y843]